MWSRAAVIDVEWSSSLLCCMQQEVAKGPKLQNPFEALLELDVE
jgi:hypothetical protein